MRLIENSTTRNLFDSLRESESIPSMKDDNFEDLVKRDFRLFLMDKYGDELYKDVTEDDVNEYFTGMFYDIWDDDDLDSINSAEDIIRNEYHLSDMNESVNILKESELSDVVNEYCDRLSKFLSKYNITFELSPKSITFLYNGDYLCWHSLFEGVNEKGRLRDKIRRIQNYLMDSGIPHCYIKEVYGNEAYKSAFELKPEYKKKRSAMHEQIRKFVLSCKDLEDRERQAIKNLEDKNDERRHKLLGDNVITIIYNSNNDSAPGGANIHEVKDLFKDIKHRTQKVGPNYYFKFNRDDEDRVRTKFNVLKDIADVSIEGLNESADLKVEKIDESVEEHDLSKDLFGDEAANRMSQKEKDLERDLQYVRDIMAGKTVIDDKYHEELSLDMAKAWLRRDFVYVNGLSVYSPDEINKRLADEYPDIFGVNESVIEPVEGKQDYELDDYADKLQQELKSIYNDDEVNALRFEILDLLNKKERANNRASGNGLKYNDKLKELIKKAESYLNESDKSLNESLDSNIDSIVDDVLSGNDVYVRLDEKDYSSEEGSNIYKIEYSYSAERPEDYDNGYNSGWDRGQDEEFDKKQDERFEKATKAYEEGEVFEFNCVKIEDGKIQYTGFCLLKCFGIEELRENLEYYKAKRIGVKTISSFEDLTESAKSKKEKKENKRVLMQQGNVTCVEENAKYKVFENEQDNLVEYDNKDEAMKDALNRCGVNPDNDLKEKE